MTAESFPPGADESLSKLGNAISAQLQHLDSRPVEAGLYLVATPIGNLSDITLRALHILARANVVYCEDTRQTRKLMERYALQSQLRSYHDHNADRERPRLLATLAAGKVVALVSDAGTPLVSDPGHKLVREARAANILVRAIPGPSAVLAGLTVSGLEIDRFFFEGFLPSKGAARRDRLARLQDVPGTLVFYEAPGRLAATLVDLHKVLGDRMAIATRELTKRHEEHRSGSLSELAAYYEATAVRGEIVILVAPPSKQADVDDDTIRNALTGLRGTMSLRDASRELAGHFGIPRKRIYDLGLAQGSGDGET
ncbi:MAG: 16S rRNA (cytidine(1402)-2'-O)-methyltransferase [Hyphomicrobiaceae bacterium]